MEQIIVKFVTMFHGETVDEVIETSSMSDALWICENYNAWIAGVSEHSDECSCDFCRSGGYLRYINN